MTDKDIVKRVNKMVEESDVKYYLYDGDTLFVRIKLPNGIVLTDSITSAKTTLEENLLKEICVAKIKNRIIEYERYYESQLEYEHKNTKENNKSIDEINNKDKKNILSDDIVNDIIDKMYKSFDEMAELGKLPSQKDVELCTRIFAKIYNVNYDWLLDKVCKIAFNRAKKTISNLFKM